MSGEDAVLVVVVVVVSSSSWRCFLYLSEIVWSIPWVVSWVCVGMADDGGLLSMTGVMTICIVVIFTLLRRWKVHI